MNPHDALNDEEQFTLLLAGYSEEMIDGRNVDPADNSSLSPELRQRLQRALDCLRRLRRSRTDGEKSPTVPMLAPADVPFSEGPARRRIGRFRLVRELGRGGCGIVFLAFDPLLRRDVALKIPKLDVLLTPDMRQRFQREAEAAAQLNHPNLVAVHESGEADGLHYIVSAYCPGHSLAAWLEQQNTPPLPRTAARWVAALADAVQHVHDHGIWHRDIKPGNILLDPCCAVSTATDDPGFTPRLTDFGMAKFLEGGTPSTQSGTLMGTLSYMAPEQARGDSREIGSHTDVYGLGAVLYEMLTGRPPFRGVTDADTLGRVLEAEPTRPRCLRPETPRNIEIICLKCLEKEAGRRYASAAALADDLRRFLAGEPIQALPPKSAERLYKWTRRHPWIAASACFGCLAVLVLLTAGFWLDALKRAHDADLEVAAKRYAERQETICQKEQSLRLDRYADDIALAFREWDKRHLAVMVNQLERHCLPPGPHDPDDPRGFEWHYLYRLARTLRCRMPPTEALNCVAFSSGGMTCATGHQDGTIHLFDPFTGQRRQVLTRHRLPVNALAYSRDGKYLVSGGGVCADGRNEGELFLWDAATLTFRHTIPGPLGAVNCLAFSPDCRNLAAALAGDEIKIWSMPSRTPRTTIPFPGVGVVSVAFHADSATLAVGLNDGRMSLGDAASGRVLATWQGHQGRVQSVACGHANSSLVSAGAGSDHTVRLWRGTGSRSLAGEYRHDDEVWSVAFSPDDRTVASLSKDGVVKLWDVARQRACFLAAIPPGWGRTVTFAPDGKTLAVGSEDGNRLWICDLSRSTEAVSWLGHRDGGVPREAWVVAFSPDGKTLASAGDDHVVRLWDPTTGRERAVLRGHQALVTSVAFSPDGKWLASGSFDETAPVKLWDAVSGAEVFTFHGHTRPLDCLAFSPDSKILATGGRDNTVRLWDLISGRECETLRVPKIESLVFSPDGRALWLASNEQIVFLWDLERRKRRLTLPPHYNDHVSLAVTPDGKTLATGDRWGTVRFWDAQTGKLRVSHKHHETTVNCLAFSPDGKTLASASFDNTIKLWQTATGRDLLTLSREADRVRWVAFSPDGRMLATAGHDGMLKIYRGAAEEE